VDNYLVKSWGAELPWERQFCVGWGGCLGSLASVAPAEEWVGQRGAGQYPALSPLCSFSFCVSVPVPLHGTGGKGCAPLAFIGPAGWHEADGWGNPLLRSAG